MYIHFIYIIIVQALTYFVCAWYRKKFLTLKELLLSALCGIVLGALFDVIVGSLHLYTYIRDDGLMLSYPWNLTFPELLTNGALSFGLAVATAKVILEKKVQLPDTERIKLFTIFLTILNISLFALIFANLGSLMLMILCGLIIVSVGELILLVRKNYGPVGELFSRSLTSRTLRLWLYSIGIGLACEVTNSFFPFWQWLPERTIPSLIIIPIITIFGYAALLHPMIVFWRLREK